MSTLITYKTIDGGPIQEVSPDPTAAAGLALNTNFRAIADSIQTLESDSGSTVSSASGTMPAGGNTDRHSRRRLGRHTGMLCHGGGGGCRVEPNSSDDQRHRAERNGVREHRRRFGVRGVAGDDLRRQRQRLGVQYGDSGTAYLEYDFGSAITIVGYSVQFVYGTNNTTGQAPTSWKWQGPTTTRPGAHWTISRPVPSHGPIRRRAPSVPATQPPTATIVSPV